jgi:hypothetical protein
MGGKNPDWTLLMVRIPPSIIAIQKYPVVTKSQLMIFRFTVFAELSISELYFLIRLDFYYRIQIDNIHKAISAGIVGI